jgi:hypothetical protein
MWKRIAQSDAGAQCRMSLNEGVPGTIHRREMSPIGGPVILTKAHLFAFYPGQKDLACNRREGLEASARSFASELSLLG